MKIHTDFPGANGLGFEWLAPDHLRFQADLRGGKFSMWFHFVVEEPACDVLHCELTQGKTALGWPYQPCVRPLFRRAGETWERVPPTIVQADAGTFRFDVACRRKTTEVAFCYPCQLADWDRFFTERLAPRGAKRVTLGKSAGGRPLFACEWGKGQNVVFLSARAHSGETPGGHTLEGIFAELVEASIPDLSIYAIPFLDVDGVVTGMYGKERHPADINRSWQGESLHPEVPIYKSYLESLPHPPRVAVDCHAPTAWDPTYIDCMTWAGATPDFVERLNRLVQGAIRESQGQPGAELHAEKTAAHPGWYPDGFERSICGYLQSTYGTLAFTLESSYHATHRGEMVGPREWHDVGRAVGRAILGSL